MLHQVEFLIEGSLLPITIEELRVTKNLLIEKVLPKSLDYGQRDYAIAYVGVDTNKEENFFRMALDYLDFFLLVHSLMSGQPVTSRIGAGTTLDDLNSLGIRRITFPDYEKIHMVGGSHDGFLKPVLEIKERFVQLLPDRQRIMESHLGLALIYYYYAVLASRRRLEEATINLMIASEALLILRNEKIRSSLSRRLSTLIAENEPEKEAVSKKMGELYDLRSAIVHGRGKRPSFSDVRTLFGYVQRAISQALCLRHLPKEKLVERLDSKSTQ